LDDPSLGLLFGSIILLVFLSAYFSGSETAMMALNRYRLKHLANDGHRGAIQASKLLERPDRLLGVILIGNNLVNFSAASLATVIAIELFGESGVAIAPVVCTLVFLIFSEVAPKTISAAYPEKIALPSSYILSFLLWILFPLVWMVNGSANAMLKLIGIRGENALNDELSAEELRTVVEDIMVPRTEIFGIDIEDDIEEIITQIKSSQHTRLPVFKEDIDRVIGVLHLRDTAKFLTDTEISKASILQVTEEPYFVPENTPLQTQLVNFQKHKERLALVVDEYGEIKGIIAIEDILEEIVGEFTTDLANTNVDIHPQEEGVFLIEGSTHLRLINRQLGWTLPQDGPKTLSGLIIEAMETIPESNVCTVIGSYRIEVVQIQDNMIKTARVSEVADPF
jgi:Mg2+/Co2+ transporter CorB